LFNINILLFISEFWCECLLVFDSAPKQDQTGCNGAFILCCDLRYSQNM